MQRKQLQQQAQAPSNPRRDLDAIARENPLLFQRNTDKNVVTRLFRKMGDGSSMITSENFTGEGAHRRRASTSVIQYHSHIKEDGTRVTYGRFAHECRGCSYCTGLEAAAALGLDDGSGRDAKREEIIADVGHIRSIFSGTHATSESGSLAHSISSSSSSSSSANAASSLLSSTNFPSVLEDQPRNNWAHHLRSFLSHLSPRNLAAYASLTFAFVLLYLFLRAVISINRDVLIIHQRLQAERLHEAQGCADSYNLNRCSPQERVPALVSQCEKWEKCMTQDLDIKFLPIYFRIFSEAIVDFFEPMPLKTALIITLLVMVAIGSFFKLLQGAVFSIPQTVIGKSDPTIRTRYIREE